MFFVFNKDKITAYVVTVFTVVALFLTASVINKEKESIQTSVNEIKINNTTENETEVEIKNGNNKIINTNLN